MKIRSVPCTILPPRCIRELNHSLRESTSSRNQTSGHLWFPVPTGPVGAGLLFGLLSPGVSKLGGSQAPGVPGACGGLFRNLGARGISKLGGFCAVVFPGFGGGGFGGFETGGGSHHLGVFRNWGGGCPGFRGGLGFSGFRGLGGSGV